MSDVTTLTLPIPEPVFWFFAWFLAAAAAMAAVLWVLRQVRDDSKDRVAPVIAKLGIEGIPPVAFVVGAALWLALVGVLVTGLFFLVWQMLWFALPNAEAMTEAERVETRWDFRFGLARIVALTTVLAALVALPITLTRLRIAREAEETAKATLFNQKITEAAADLHAQRQVTKWVDGVAQNGWEDDIVRRNAAIDRLEGLVREEPEEADRVARLLSVYVRELSKKQPPKPVPNNLRWEEALSGAALNDWWQKLHRWTSALEPARSDMENAVKVLGKLTKTAKLKENTLPIDLRGANLQGFDLTELDFRKANLSGAQMQGAMLDDVQMQATDLSGAEMQGADLGGAKMLGANLSRAEMQGANLGGADLQGANLRRVQMQGADLDEVKMDASTDLTGARFLAAQVKSVDDITIAQLKPFWDVIFADGSVPVILDDPDRPDRWPKEKLDYDEFNEAWRMWMTGKGLDPDDPATWG